MIVLHTSNHGSDSGMLLRQLVSTHDHCAEVSNKTAPNRPPVFMGSQCIAVVYDTEYGHESHRQDLARIIRPFPQLHLHNVAKHEQRDWQAITEGVCSVLSKFDRGCLMQPERLSGISPVRSIQGNISDLVESVCRETKTSTAMIRLKAMLHGRSDATY